MIVTSIRSIALYGGVFLLPLFLQNFMHRTEVDTGLLLLPGALVIGAMMLSLVGLSLTAWFMWLYRNLDVTTSTWHVLYPTLIRGVGLGLLVTPVMTAAMNSVPTHKVGMASSMLSLVQQISGSLGIAILASVLGHRETFHRTIVGQGLDPSGAAFQDATRAVSTRALELGMSLSDANLVGASMVGRRAAEAAGVLAFNDAFLVGAAIVIARLIPALFLESKPAV